MPPRVPGGAPSTCAICDAVFGSLKVACVAVAFSVRKQGLHDKMAGAILTRP